MIFGVWAISCIWILWAVNESYKKIQLIELVYEVTGLCCFTFHYIVQLHHFLWQHTRAKTLRQYYLHLVCIICNP